MAPQLALRDIHQAAAPPWWPPAPGWWIAAAIVVVAAGAIWLMRRRRIRRVRVLEAMFDNLVDAAAMPSAKVRAMSELLRRAARRRQADADTLDGEAWLRFLDSGYRVPVFATATGRVLVDGAFRPEVDEHEVRALRDIARPRFVSWMRQ